jgi:LysM repeat protein
MGSISTWLHSLRKKLVKRSLVTSPATYTIQAGDTFSSIAAKLGLTLSVIEAANPGVNPNNLQIGQVIQLTQPASNYTVNAGDTFYSVATKFGISVAALEAANPGVSPTSLQIGQQISIPWSANVPVPTPQPQPQPQPQPIPVPNPAPTLPAPTPSSGTYTISAGDTFTTIAAKLGITVAALEAANPGLNPNDLQIGAKISTGSAPVPPAPQPTPNPAPSPASTYVIQVSPNCSE